MKTFFCLFLCDIEVVFDSDDPGDESRQDAGRHQEGHDQTQLGAGEDRGLRADAEDLRGQRCKLKSDAFLFSIKGIVYPKWKLHYSLSL